MVSKLLGSFSIREKGVGGSRQLDGGHGSRHPLRSVTTHQPNPPAPKMDDVCPISILPIIPFVTADPLRKYSPSDVDVVWRCERS